MSSKQDLIEMQEVIKQCLTLIKDLSNGWEGVVKSISKINSNKPSTYIAIQKELKQSVDALNDSEIKLTKSMEKKEQVEKKAQATAQQLLTSGFNLNKQKEKELATEAKLQAQLEKSQNTYNRVQQKVNETTQAYNNLATKKALGIDLNDKEQRTLALLEARLTKYNGVLKGVDANIGKHQRNVGNYASGWNGLSNSINQITREMPAFAVSMNTGFLALSNNIPMLFDEIQRVRNQVAGLRAEGKPTESVLTKLASSFFSLQTAISLGVTLLTVYGADFIKFVSNVLKGDEAVSALTRSQEAYNESLKSGEYTKAYSDVTKVGLAFEQAKKGVISKKEALEIYNKTLGNVLGSTNDIDVAEARYIKNSENYVKAMLARASANYLLTKSAEVNAKLTELRNKKEITVWEKTKAYLEDAVRPVSYGFSPTNLALLARTEEAGELTKELNNYKESISSFYKEFETLSKGMNTGNVFEDFGADSKKDKKPKKEKDYTSDRIKSEFALEKAIIDRLIVEETEQEKVTLYKIALADLEYREKQILANKEIADKETLKNTLLAYEKEYQIKIIELIKEEENARNKSNEAINKELDKQYEDKLKAEQDNIDKVSKIINDDLRKEEEEEAKHQQKLLDIRAKFLDSLKNTAYDSLSGLGGESLVQFFNGEFEAIWKGAETTAEKVAIAMKAIGEISMAVMGQISAMQQANFDAQLSRLNTEKEVALQFAGDSASGREAIEQQYEAKRKDIQKRQAIAEKKMAIMQIAMNTAVGVTSALASLPPNVPLSIAIGVIGAIQAGIVASTPIPEFWTGTENAPEGLALTQERGAEMITDKNGRIKTLGNSKGAQLTYLNKGDKVLNASDTTDKINEMLMGSGISPIVKVENKVLTKAEMIDVMNQTLAKQPKIRPIFDEKGARTYIERENSRTIKRGNNARI